MKAERDRQLSYGKLGRVQLGFSVGNLSALGLVDDALSQAGNLRDESWANPGALFTPATAPLRRDRRFMAAAAKLGLVDYWRSTGKWPDFCADPELPYDCKAEAARYR
jgi:hypothetical protein